MQSEDRQRAILVALWKRMRETFGQTWTREYGDIDGEAINTWQHSLGFFTPNQIARGVKSAQEWKRDFPPTLPQFKDLCLTRRPEEIKPVVSEVKSLEDLTRRKRNDSPAAAAAKADIQLILAKEYTVTKQESYEDLGLQRRWGRL